MLILALGGVVLGFAFLLLSLLTDNAAWAYGCIAVCVVAGALLVLDVVRRRRPAAASSQSDAAPDAVPADPERADAGLVDPAETGPSDPGEPDPAGSGPAAGTAPEGTAPVAAEGAERSERDREPDARGEDPTEVIGADRAAGGGRPAADEPVADLPTQQIPAVRDDGPSAAGLLDGPERGGAHRGPDTDTPARDGADPADTDRSGYATEVPDPADAEPDVEDPSSQDGATAAASEAEVLVVDERPRFHVAGCSWLEGRETIPLPAREAVDLGFTPCAVCRPVAALARA